MTAERVVGLLLSGGRGSRHGGADKGWVEYQQRPLVEHALQHLKVCERVIISANRNQARYARLGVQVVSDQRAGYQGPLSGIESAFAASDAEWLYVLPVDVLGMPDNWLEQQQKAVAQSGLPWCGTLDAGRVQPLLGLWSRELLTPLTAYLDRGERRVMRFVEPWADHVLRLPEGQCLCNLNSPESLV